MGVLHLLSCKRSSAWTPPRVSRLILAQFCRSRGEHLRAAESANRPLTRSCPGECPPCRRLAADGAEDDETERRTIDAGHFERTRQFSSAASVARPLPDAGGPLLSRAWHWARSQNLLAQLSRPWRSLTSRTAPLIGFPQTWQCGTPMALQVPLTRRGQKPASAPVKLSYPWDQRAANAHPALRRLLSGSLPADNGGNNGVALADRRRRRRRRDT
jgi:hypothetical protein